MEESLQLAEQTLVKLKRSVGWRGIIIPHKKAKSSERYIH